MTLNLKWKDMEYKIAPPLLKALEADFGFANVMPVQNAVVPVFSKNFDVAVEASTGSGKTLAFLVPIFEKLIKDHPNIEKEDIKALIISPTRELAYQTYQVATKIQQSIGKFGVKVIFGKIGEKEDQAGNKANAMESNGQNILITTPGRIAEILKDNLKDLKSIEFLVLGRPVVNLKMKLTDFWIPIFNRN